MPRKILVRNRPGYVIVDQDRSGRNPDGSWSIHGVDSEGRQAYNLQAADSDVSSYSGPDSPYWQERLVQEEAQRAAAEEKRSSEEETRKGRERSSAESMFLAGHGLSRRKMEKEWQILPSLPDLNIDALHDQRIKQQTLQVLKQRTGYEFSDAELEQIAKLHVYKDDMIRVKSTDPATGTVVIFSPILGEDDQEIVSVRVLKAFGAPMMPSLPEGASQQGQQRKTRALKPYASDPEFQESGLSREVMMRMTPLLARYVSNARLKGDIYENFGIQSHGEPLGERMFADEMGTFGMPPKDLPDDILHYNPTRGGMEDEKLRGAWSGYVTLMPDETGRVPMDVLSEAMNIAADSRPHLRAGDKFVPYDQNEFLAAYKRGPVYFSSNNLFRHMVGLGYFGNDWQGKVA